MADFFFYGFEWYYATQLPRIGGGERPGVVVPSTTHLKVFISFPAGNFGVA